MSANTSSCVLVLDASTHVRFASYSACKVFGVSESELLHQPVQTLLDTIGAEVDLQQIRHTICLERRFSLEIAYRTRLGTTGLLRTELDALVDDDGGLQTVIVLIHAFQDIRLTSGLELQTLLGFDNRYLSSSLTYEKGKDLFLRMDALVREQELYRKSKISVSMLAHRLNTNTQYLSHVINYFCGERFPNYVNRLRLQWMSQHVGAQWHTRKSPVWSDAGFGSYSAYHRAARTLEVTPTHGAAALTNRLTG